MMRRAETGSAAFICEGNLICEAMDLTGTTHRAVGPGGDDVGRCP